jgi:hypothetical protein
MRRQDQYTLHGWAPPPGAGSGSRIAAHDIMNDPARGALAGAHGSGRGSAGVRPERRSVRRDRDAHEACDSRRQIVTHVSPTTSTRSSVLAHASVGLFGEHPWSCACRRWCWAWRPSAPACSREVAGRTEKRARQLLCPWLSPCLVLAERAVYRVGVLLLSAQRLLLRDCAARTATSSGGVTPGARHLCALDDGVSRAESCGALPVLVRSDATRLARRQAAIGAVAGATTLCFSLRWSAACSSSSSGEPRQKSRRRRGRPGAAGGLPAAWPAERPAWSGWASSSRGCGVTSDRVL